MSAVLAYHKFVKTTPKPRATKKRSGELVAEAPELDDEVAAGVDIVDEGAGVATGVDVVCVPSSPLATTCTISTKTSLMAGMMMAFSNALLHERKERRRE